MTTTATANPWQLLAAQTAPRTRVATRKTRLQAGQVVHHWTLLEYLPGTHRAMAKWRCRCSCDAVRLVQSNNLLRGGSRSCGHTRDPGKFVRATP